jgi:heme A synthase
MQKKLEKFVVSLVILIKLLHNVMNKTVVASVGIVTLGFVCIGACLGILCYMYFSSIVYNAAHNAETRDRLTVCIQMVMSESRASDKLVDAEKAREICS